VLIERLTLFRLHLSFTDRGLKLVQDSGMVGDRKRETELVGGNA